MKNNIIKDKSFAFAVRIVNLSQILIKDKHEFILSKQILKSGTSIGANIEEAIGGHSRADFYAKVTIAYKETRETIYWLKLLHQTKFITDEIFESLKNDAEEICKIITAIQKTTKENN